MKRFTFSLLTSLISIILAWGQPSADYYKSCEGKAGVSLLQALHSVIGSHKTVSYDGLWEVYKKSDVRANGRVWDMYSTKEWVVGQEKCGNYKNVGDCINREHSFPKSWFNDKSPMYSDAFHLYPTDGKVNGQRSNFPYGECSGGTTLPSNGNVKALGRLGNSTFAGYTGTVFEPVDEYKGDFARSYFYMAACYYDRISTWSSPMLAGNNYPAFTTWAVNLLLKWHRQDPVSDKEINRNNAVYGFQQNRNPFIDHPELAEYIWGTKQGLSWTPGGEVTPVITAPADGSTVDVGVTGIGIERTLMIPVKGTNIQQKVTASVTGEGFYLYSTSVTADAANSGRGGILVAYSSDRAANGTGVLTLRSGDITSRVNLTASAQTGLPVGEATDISETSFVAHWANVDGDGAVYSLMLYLNDSPVAGYPVRVPAEDESWLVEDLEPASSYSYTLSNGKDTSRKVNVTTSTPIPSIQFMFDGELEFVTAPGESSNIAEILLDIENISDNVTVSVTEPFSVSTDKSDWSTSVVLVPGEDRFYLRLYGMTDGTYRTTVMARAGEYVNDDLDVTGYIRSGVSFLEDFEYEEGNNKESYTNGRFNGTMGVWNMTDAGVWTRDKSKAYEGYGVCCLGKNSSSSIATAEPKTGGIGTVKFMAKPWDGDADAVIAVQYSTDGKTWNSAGTVAVTGSTYVEQSVDVNKSGSLYLRLQQTEGKRVLIDNVSATDCSDFGGVGELYYHSWDAFSRDGSLVIENGDGEASFLVFGVDGIERFSGRLPQGESVISLPAGLYIIASGDFTRRVVVK